MALKAELGINGVAISQEALGFIQPGVKAQEQVHCLFEMDFETHDVELPSHFYLPLGSSCRSGGIRARPNASTCWATAPSDRGRRGARRSAFPRATGVLRRARRQTASRCRRSARITPIAICSSSTATNAPTRKRAKTACSATSTSPRTPTARSRACSGRMRVRSARPRRGPIAIGEIDHLTVTGGVIPERRELEYYLDVAEAIQQHTGREDFNGTATVAAPLDLRNLDRFKEAGYRTTAMNIEIWDKGIYEAICPGKARGGGGWEHWVKALEYAAKVFGHGRVRSNIVAGIEPKRSHARRARISGVEGRGRHLDGVVPESRLGAGGTPLARAVLVSRSRPQAGRRSGRRTASPTTMSSIATPRPRPCSTTSSGSRTRRSRCSRRPRSSNLPNGTATRIDESSETEAA